MPLYEIKVPDGRKVQIRADDPQMAEQRARQWYAEQRSQPPKPKPERPASPKRQVSTGEDVARSGGGGFLRGATDLLDAIPGAPSNLLSNLRVPGLQLPSAANVLGTVITAAGGQNPFAYKPQTTAGKYAEKIGEFAPGVVNRGSALRRAAQVVVPAVASEGARQGVEALGGGAKAQAAAEVVGAVAGGGASSLRTPRASVEEQAVRALGGGRRGSRTAVTEAQQRVAEMRSYGAEPVLADVIGDAGQGVVRAAATRQTPARQQAVDFAAGRREDMQDFMGDQVDRFVSNERRTPQQIEEALTTRQRELATQEFAAPYAQQVEVTPQLLDALGGEPGQAAMRRARAAAVARRDDQQVAEIDALLAGQAPTVSAATVDRIRIAMREGADVAGRRGAGARASGLRGRESDIDATLSNVDGLAPARETYAGLSQQIEAIPLGRQLRSPTGSQAFAQQVGQLSPDARGVVREVGAGELREVASTPAGAAQLADQLAVSRARQRQMGAILPADQAQGLQRGAQIGREMLTTARNVNPRAGSESSLNLQDAGALALASEGARAAGNAARGNLPALIGQGVDWLRSRGMSDAQAQAIVQMSLDPAQTDRALQLIAQRLGTQAANDYARGLRVAVPGLLALQGAQGGQ